MDKRDEAFFADDNEAELPEPSLAETREMTKYREPLQPEAG
ncbi:MAG TPA: hypothetical protein VG937_27370 [Polyangiaceae bacterium]|nr:hypothetical protein [Polyangiaceae bacterium]